MVLTKCKDVTKQGTVKYSEENSLFREVSILGGVEGGSEVGVGIYLSLSGRGWGDGGCLLINVFCL